MRLTRTIPRYTRPFATLPIGRLLTSYKHGEFLKSIPKRLGGAAIFGAGATAGADAVNSALGH